MELVGGVVARWEEVTVVGEEEFGDLVELLQEALDERVGGRSWGRLEED